MAESDVLVGVDFGGSKIEVAAINADGGYLQRIRTATPTCYDDAIRAIVELVGQVERQLGHVPRVGVGLPGSRSPRTGLIYNSNALYLNGRPFGTDLQQALGREVVISNDANCLAVSEAADGAAADAKTVFAVVLGTGCGGGLAIDGRVVGGGNGLAGEWGHNPLPSPTQAEAEAGMQCWCGRTNCIELWVSGTGLARTYATATGMHLDAPAIVAAMRRGERTAAAHIDAWLDRLARGLAAIVNIVDPEVFVFGGGLAQVEEIYVKLPVLMRDHVFSDAWSAKLSPAKWGDASGVRGAARL